MKYYKNPNTNEVYVYESDGSQDAFIKEGLAAITVEEVADVQQARNQAAFDALTYAEKRAQAYPSLPDQLDQIYHEGVDAWKATIAAVKMQYPKPE